MSKVMIGLNDLATANPKLAKEWHPTKNGDLTPRDVGKMSNKKVWWLGPCGHEWQAIVANRNIGNACPICAGKKVLSGFNDLATINPELATEWHPTRNGDLLPSHVTPGSNKKVWWLGKCGHEWPALVASRRQGHGCPHCIPPIAIIGVNDLTTTHPNLAAEWHPTKNGDLLPSHVTPGSNKKVWWLGPCGHEWQTYIFQRVRGDRCPVCRRMRKDLRREKPSLKNRDEGKITPPCMKK